MGFRVRHRVGAAISRPPDEEGFRSVFDKLKRPFRVDSERSFAMLFRFSELSRTHGAGVRQIPHAAGCMGTPKGSNMLGAHELPLRQGFAWGKTLVRRKRRPICDGAPDVLP